MADGETPDSNSSNNTPAPPSSDGGPDFRALYQAEKARADKAEEARQRANDEARDRRLKIKELEGKVGDRDGLADDIEKLRQENAQLGRLADVGAAAQKRAATQVADFLARDDVPTAAKAKVEARKADPLDALDIVEIFGAVGTKGGGSGPPPADPPPADPPQNAGSGTGSGTGQPLDPSQMSRAEVRAFMRDPEKRKAWEAEVGIKDRGAEVDIFDRERGL